MQNSVCIKPSVHRRNKNRHNFFTAKGRVREYAPNSRDSWTRGTAETRPGSGGSARPAHRMDIWEQKYFCAGDFEVPHLLRCAVFGPDDQLRGKLVAGVLGFEFSSADPQFDLHFDNATAIFQVPRSSRDAPGGTRSDFTTGALPSKDLTVQLTVWNIPFADCEDQSTDPQEAQENGLNEYLDIDAYVLCLPLSDPLNDNRLSDDKLERLIKRFKDIRKGMLGRNGDISPSVLYVGVSSRPSDESVANWRATVSRIAQASKEEVQCVQDGNYTIIRQILIRYFLDRFPKGPCPVREERTQAQSTESRWTSLLKSSEDSETPLSAMTIPQQSPESETLPPKGTVKDKEGRDPGRTPVTSPPSRAFPDNGSCSTVSTPSTAKASGKQREGFSSPVVSPRYRRGRGNSLTPSLGPTSPTVGSRSTSQTPLPSSSPSQHAGCQTISSILEGANLSPRAAKRGGKR